MKFSQPAPRTDRGEVIFLLHGIGKGRFDMMMLHKYLRRRGYEVINWNYPSTKLTLEEIADQLKDEVDKHEGQTVHFVTHSMGGIVARTYFTRHCADEPTGRMVMIAPPNQGALLADFFGDWLPYKFIFGPAGQQLRQGDKGSCSAAGVPKREFGIISGGTGRKTGINPLIPGDNDGTISVECTHLEGEKDFIVLPYAHPMIQMMPRTAENVLSFIENGYFLEKDKPVI